MHTQANFVNMRAMRLARNIRKQLKEIAIDRKFQRYVASVGNEKKSSSSSSSSSSAAALAVAEAGVECAVCEEDAAPHPHSLACCGSTVCRDCFRSHMVSTGRFLSCPASCGGAVDPDTVRTVLSGCCVCCGDGLLSGVDAGGAAAAAEGAGTVDDIVALGCGYDHRVHRKCLVKYVHSALLAIDQASRFGSGWWRDKPRQKCCRCANQTARTLTHANTHTRTRACRYLTQCIESKEHPVACPVGQVCKCSVGESTVLDALNGRDAVLRKSVLTTLAYIVWVGGVVSCDRVFIVGGGLAVVCWLVC